MEKGKSLNLHMVLDVLQLSAGDTAALLERELK
jgi:hypothetical protein